MSRNWIMGLVLGVVLFSGCGPDPRILEAATRPVEDGDYMTEMWKVTEFLSSARAMDSPGTPANIRQYAREDIQYCQIRLKYLEGLYRLDKERMNRECQTTPSLRD